MTYYYIIPGLGNSDETHWQTYFESLDSTIKRINQVEWDAPNCADWLETIEFALTETDLSHINVASGYGEWKEGFELLKKYFG